MNHQNILPGRSLLISKQPKQSQSVLRTTSEKTQKQNYLIANQGGIFKRSEINSSENAGIRVLDSEMNVYKSNGSEKEKLIEKLGAQFEKSNILIQPEKLTELVNQIQMIPQTQDNCIKVENNIFVISSCQMLNNPKSSASEVVCEANQQKEERARSIPPSESTEDLPTNEENHSNLAEYFHNFSVPPDFIQNLNETQLNYVTKAISSVPTDGNFSFWM